MAADVLESDSLNRCCAKLKQKYLKAKNNFNLLKGGVKVLEDSYDSLKIEHLQLKKAYEDLQLCGKQEREDKIKDSEIKKRLEKEVHDLKEKISSYKKKECLTEVHDSKEKISSYQKKECLTEVHDSKEKISSYQKKECLTNVNDDENKLLKARILECQGEIKKIKELLEKEKKKSDSEKKKAELERKKAEEAWKLVKEEKLKADEERKLAAVVREESEEYKVSWEKAKSETKELKVQLSKANAARKRVEEEKQKISIEKTYADSHTKKLMEVERRRAVEEKARADHFSQMFEEEKHRREEIQKKLEDVESTSKGRCDSCDGEKMHSSYVGIINANMKLLRKQLKLEKKQAKHAKRMAKLEKAEKSYIMQEHRSLKHSIMQMVYRFNMLDDRISHSIEGTDAVAKIDKPCKTYEFKMENLLGSKRVNHCSRIDCGLSKTCCMGSFNLTEPTSDIVGLPLRRRSCTRLTTGIISELKSPIGGSDRNKSQSSAICSNTSYSDKRSMGSQERGSIAVCALAELTKKHPNEIPGVMKLASEVAKTNKSREIGGVTNNVDKDFGCRLVGNACLTASVHDAKEVIDAEFDRSSKRRKLWDSMDPIATLFAESKQSNIDIKENLAASKDDSNVECQIPVQNCSQGHGVSWNCSSEGQNGSGGQNCNRSGKAMKRKHRTPGLEDIAQNVNEKQFEKFSSPRNRDPSIFAETTPPFHQVGGNICIPGDLICFENMIRGNCLKLLDLDNVADEERYRMAVERPLSPTLPGFKLLNNQLHVEDNTKHVMETENSVSLHSIDIRAMEIRSSDASGHLPSHKSQDSLYPTEASGYNCVNKLKDCGRQHGWLNGAEDSQGYQKVEQMYPAGKSGDNMIDTVKSSIGKTDNFMNNSPLVVNVQDKACWHVGTATSNLVENQTEAKIVAPDDIITSSRKNKVLSPEIRKFTEGDADIHQLSEASKQTALSTSCNTEDTSSRNADFEIRKSPLCCAVFSNIKAEDCISRIFCTWNTFSHRTFIASEVDRVVVQVHNALAKNTALLPEEKGSVLFSLLLCNISSRMSANFKCAKSEDLLPYFVSFAEDINKVLFDAKVNSLLKEICQLDVLLDVTKDFLIERKVLMYIDGLYECNDTSSSLFQLDGAHVFSRAATIDQFVTGCIILASISAAANRVDFLLEASYKILRMCKSDISWSLFALHIFASVCGKEFFNVTDYGFLIITLRSVVLLLERGHQSVSHISPHFHSIFGIESRFSPCSECPFATGAICMDKLTNLLLDVLQFYTLSGVGYSTVNKSVGSLFFMVPTSSDKDEERGESKSVLDGQGNATPISCHLFTFSKHAAGLPDCFPERAFCHFNDIVSLVELIGLYMSWEWANGKIIPRLSKMLESCKIEEFSAALFVLIGHLARFGIDVGGHQDKGISELRSNISVFIDTSIGRKMSLQTQFAAIGALLNLLPLSFRDIIGDYEVLTLDTSQLGHAKLIKKWYLDLSRHQQSVCLNLFE